MLSLALTMLSAIAERQDEITQRDVLKRLGGVSQLPPEYRGWMLEFTGRDRQG